MKMKIVKFSTALVCLILSIINLEYLRGDFIFVLLGFILTIIILAFFNKKIANIILILMYFTTIAYILYRLINDYNIIHF